MIIVFIYFLDSCQLRQLLVETNDVAEHEDGNEYKDNYGLYYEGKERTKLGMR